MPIEDLVWEFDPDTLRELAQAPDRIKAVRVELTNRLDEVDEEADPATVADLAGQRAVLSRVLGDLDLALGDGHRALAAAERTDDPALLASARVRLAHVHQWRGEFADSDALFEQALAAEGLPAGLRASVHQHAGKNLYDQERYAEAAEAFERAVALRAELGDPELLASAEAALSAARRRG